jgi:hypothetical protein
MHFREMVLRSVNVGVIASLFTIGAVPRPNGLGIQVNWYFDLQAVSKLGN